MVSFLTWPAAATKSKPIQCMNRHRASRQRSNSGIMVNRVAVTSKQNDPAGRHAARAK